LGFFFLRDVRLHATPWVVSFSFSSVTLTVGMSTVLHMIVSMTTADRACRRP